MTMCPTYDFDPFKDNDRPVAILSVPSSPSPLTLEHNGQCLVKGAAKHNEAAAEEEKLSNL